MQTRNPKRKTIQIISYAVCLVVTAGMLMIDSPAAAVEEYSPGSSQNLVCAICHSCEFPTHKDMCLKKSFCFRHEVMPGHMDKLSLGTVILDELESVYYPVYFNHEKHAQMSQMSGGCENCHHFIPPSAGHPACKECHPAGQGRVGKGPPGLKAAYHHQCMDCHEQWDTEAHCEVCHRKKVGGLPEAEVLRMKGERHAGTLRVNELIVFKTDYDDGDEVPFHHRNHVEKYDRDCGVCHQDESCSSCHVHGVESHPLGLISDIDLHDTCYQCHDEEKGCEECHGRDRNDLFDHASTGWELKPYHKALVCTACHKVRGKYAANDPHCESCHIDGWNAARFNHASTGVVLDEVHGELDCNDCHSAGIGQPSDCSECHDDGRRYQRHASFGPGIDSGN